MTRSRPELRQSRTTALTLTLCCAPLAAQHWFEAPRLTLEVQGYPTVGLADFDHDGDADLLGMLGTSARVFLNDGKGFYVAGATSTLAANGLTNSQRLADFDGDGEIDLALAHSGASPGVRIYRGLGNGAFAAGLYVALPIAPGAMRAGQADLDAAQELGLYIQLQDAQTMALGYRLLWIDWNSSAFQAGAMSDPLAIIAPDFNDIECIDANGDTRDDLAISSKNQLYVYRTGASALDAPLALTPHTTAMPSLQPSVIFLQASDFDADGTRELLLFHATAGLFTGASLLEPQVGGGWQNGPFHAPQQNSSRAHVGDWDGDGDLDFVTNSGFLVGGGTRILRNDGAAHFSLGASAVLNTGLGAGLADVDQDGFLDFAGPGVTVYGNGRFELSGGDVDFDAVVGGGLAPRDVEGDGDVDQPQGAFTLRNDNSGVATGTSVWPAAPLQHTYGAAAAFGDWNGDGREDWIVPLFKIVSAQGATEYVSERLLSADGNGRYVDTGLASSTALGWYQFSPTTADRAVPYDVDADGDLDVVRTNGWYRNSGGGFFDAAFAWPDLGAPLRVVDVDADGQPELVTLRDGAVDELVLHALVAPLSFATSVLATSATLLPSVSWTDVDGDGFRDFVATAFEAGSVYAPLVVPGSASGFGSPIALPIVFGADQAQVTAEDLNGDGYRELISGASNTALLTVHPGTATRFVYGAALQFVAGPTLAFEDLDEDGDADVVAATSIENLHAHGASAGGAHQYGVGTAGSGGAVPLLGASGAFVAGSTSATLNLVQARGPAPTYLFVGGAAGNVPGFPLAGLTALVDPGSFLALVQIPAQGSGAGDGEWHLSIQVDAGLVGNVFFHQVFVVDIGVPSLVTQSNGLEIRYGS